ncbi:hypothetical protein BDY21DRAFT_261707, partial [Lineolata rhizophorae]
QLKIAEKVASFVLNFHGTALSIDDWSLRDMFIYCQGDSIQEACLATMHFSKDIHACKSCAPPQARQTAERSFDSVQESRRPLLFSLGVALLEIGHWAPLNASDPNDVNAIRRLSLRPCALGPKYQELVQKCLWLDTKSPKGISETELNCAVYENIVRPLQHLIE